MKPSIIAPALLASGLLLTAMPAFAADAGPVTQVASAADTSDRFIVLEGGRNFRDVGGYRTADGHVVKRGVMYRSGSLGNLARSAQKRVADLHLAAIIDLRSTEERSHDALDLRSTFGGAYWARDYGMSKGDMGAVFGNRENLTADGMRALMTGVYGRLAKEQIPAYREMFARLIVGYQPLVVNCTAGKDRTGIAAALVLTALGVPYETVREDFLLSNNAPGMDTLQSHMPGPLAQLPPEVVAPLIGVEGAYLDAAFAEITQEYGSINGFLRKELGVGPREITVLRQRMLDQEKM